jgi:aspartyl-tRNA(Asn)/glutamyl-tRNA(Gln) amidotransferase subunit C
MTALFLLMKKMIDTKKIAQIANLSKIALTPEEMNEFIQELEVVFSWADQLSTLAFEDIKEEEPQPMHWREDEAHSYHVNEVLANAPVQDDGMFVVPKVI